MGIGLRVLLSTAICVWALHGSSAKAQTEDALSTLAGRWRVVDDRNGEIVQDCAHSQVFRPTADGQFVDLSTELEGDAGRARYIVLQPQPHRVLLFIQGETRLTENGDPVIWWAIFTDNDHFRWRRYDWPQDATVAGEWQRCPDEAPIKH
jgi:hypothetical protein